MFILNNIKNIPNIPTTIYQFGKIKEFKQENLRTLFSQAGDLSVQPFLPCPLLVKMSPTFQRVLAGDGRCLNTL